MQLDYWNETDYYRTRENHHKLPCASNISYKNNTSILDGFQEKLVYLDPGLGSRQKLVLVAYTIKLCNHIWTCDRDQNFNQYQIYFSICTATVSRIVSQDRRPVTTNFILV